VSEIGLGAWAIGGDWGDVSNDDAEAALNAALDRGVKFVGGRLEPPIRD
jgi:aryl-alcohol dehydrogenase-like predicted oxidoreductase